MQIREGRDARAHAAVQDLWLRYAEEWMLELGPQDLSQEALWIAEEYGEPGNRLLVAWEDDDGTEAAVGCAAVKDHPEISGACELKRMMVDRERRGRGVGRALAQAALDAAREMGHERVLLDTTPAMAAARRLYRSLGFRECGAYYESPLPEPVFMEKRL